MNKAGWSADEILRRGMDYYNMTLEAFTNPILKQNLGAELRDGALIGREVELGEDVTVERGAVILGKTKILRGTVEQGAVVVDCVAQVMEARSGTLVLLVEQLNEQKVESEKGQLLTDIIIMDEELYSSMANR
jgi:UDP-3-O-[3-hydroxymyristoyl] glucosamine N-acyltransferase